MRALVLAAAIIGIAAWADEQRGIGYPTVEAALAALKARSDVKISVQGGWTIAQDPSTNTLWSFTPPNHPAHPAAVKRTVVEQDGQVRIAMSALCQASKAACDKLVADFNDLNQKIASSMRSKAQTAPDSEIKVEPLGDNSFRLVLKSLRSNSVDAGQAELLPKARELCGTKAVGYGRYEFEFSEPLTPSPANRPLLLLRQQINCGDAAAPAAIVSTGNKDRDWRPSDAEAQAVERRTYAYLSAKDKGDYRQAYSFFSPTQKETVSYDRWASSLETFNTRAGPVRSRKIRKITWYKDPPRTSPGIYAAVDLTSEFENVEIHCGYVAWYEQPDGSFLLVREEENMIDKQSQQKMKAEDVERIRSRFGC